MPSASYMRRKWKYRYKREKAIIAIVIDWVNGKPVGRKYHTQDLPGKLKRFEYKCRQLFPAAQYVNYYHNGQFLRRSYIIEQKILPCNGKVATKVIYFKNYGDDMLRCIMENSLY